MEYTNCKQHTWLTTKRGKTFSIMGYGGQRLLISLLMFVVLSAKIAKATPFDDNFDPRTYLETYGYMDKDNEMQLRPDGPKSEGTISSENSFRFGEGISLEDDAYEESVEFEDNVRGENSVSDEDNLENAIKEFQESYKNFGLQPTGIVDQKTESLMKTPRCGSTDNVSDDGHDSPKGKWNKRNLTYKINVSASKVSKISVRKEFRRAFSEWEKVANLLFTEVEHWQKSDITIKFELKGCPLGKFAFNLKAIAHAAFPNDVSGFLGHIHLDESKEWTLSGYSGVNIFQVAVHEIGHVLGLPHSQYRGSVMKPFYQYTDNFSLHEDDIKDIQYLYGPPGSNRGPQINGDRLRLTRGRNPLLLNGGRQRIVGGQKQLQLNGGRQRKVNRQKQLLLNGGRGRIIQGNPNRNLTSIAVFIG